jgi:hypothetical protein
VVSFTPVPLYPRERTLGTHWLRGWTDPRVGRCREVENFLPVRIPTELSRLLHNNNNKITISLEQYFLCEVRSYPGIGNCLLWNQNRHLSPQISPWSLNVIYNMKSPSHYDWLWSDAATCASVSLSMMFFKQKCCMHVLLSPNLTNQRQSLPSILPSVLRHFRTDVTCYKQRQIHLKASYCVTYLKMSYQLQTLFRVISIPIGTSFFLCNLIFLDASE